MTYPRDFFGGRRNNSLVVENDIINGMFDIWQRGDTQISTSGYKSDDRWFNAHGGSSKTHSKRYFNTDESGGTGTYNDLGVPGNPIYYSRTAVTSVTGASNYVSKRQHIEDVTRYSGKTVCVKFYARADGNKDVVVEPWQNFGTSGSIFNPVTAQKISLTTSFQKFVLFFDMPTVEGKVVGYDNYTAFNFWLDAGSTWSARTLSLGQQDIVFDLATVEVYPSDVELPVRVPTEAETLQKCLHYYVSEYVSGMCVTYNASYAQSNRISFPEIMRTSPSIGFSNIADNGEFGTRGSLYNNRASTKGFAPTWNWSSGSAGHSFYMAFTYEADAEL